MSNLKERFWDKVDKDKGPDDCWYWTGGVKGCGYGGIALHGDQNTIISSNRASWIVHNGEMPDKMVLHTCDNKLCVNPDHLYLGSAQDNTKDALERGQFPTGEDHGSAKLTEPEVREIKRRYEDGGVSQQELADEYGVSRTPIRKIINNETWTHIEYE